MNRLLRMLLAAMMRARCGRAAALDQGVERHAVEAAEHGQQEQVRQHAPVARIGQKSPTPDSAAWCSPWLAKYSSMANTLMPIEPNGTSPISTWRPERRSHSSEPMPMPSERPPAASSPRSGRRRAPPGEAEEGSQHGGTEEPQPGNAQQAGEDGAVLVRQLQVAPVSLSGFQLMRRSGCGAGETGTPRDTSRPASASAGKRAT